MDLYELVSGAPAVAMLGMCKNAGKTTALNRLIRDHAARGGGTLALTSIGRDGEGRDLVTGTDKPPIWMYEGMLAATAAGLLPRCDISREILASTGIPTSLGEVILFRARSDGFVQLAGPAIVSQLGPLREITEAWGAEQLLIDGALHRRSPLAGVTDGVVVLSTGASLDRDMDRVVAETAYTVQLLELPELSRFSAGEGQIPDGSAPAVLFREDGSREEAERLSELTYGSGRETVALSGALTETQAAALVKDGRKKEGLTLLVRDSSCLLLKRESFGRLRAQGLSFAVRRSTKLAAVTVDPVSAGGWHFDPDEFLIKMRAAVSVPVMDVMRE